MENQDNDLTLKLIDDSISQLNDTIINLKNSKTIHHNVTIPLITNFNQAIIALNRVRPIFEIKDLIQDKIIKPIQEGIEKGFKGSNRWGIGGIIIAVIATILNIALTPHIVPKSDIDNATYYQDRIRNSENIKMVHDQNQELLSIIRNLNNNVQKLNNMPSTASRLDICDQVEIIND